MPDHNNRQVKSNAKLNNPKKTVNCDKNKGGHEPQYT